MLSTKTDRLSPFALAIATWSLAAPKTRNASASASTQAVAPALGALQLRKKIATMRTTTGTAASSQFASVRSGPVTGNAPRRQPRYAPPPGPRERRTGW